ncbi:hypothetical protein [Burkholderia gladioli]|nr:hypothetical protein [Burkholderia gladioli]
MSVSLNYAQITAQALNAVLSQRARPPTSVATRSRRAKTAPAGATAR